MYFNALGRPFVHNKIKSIIPLLPKDTPILDIGSGNGLAAHLLKEKGFNIIPLDIHEGHYHPDVKPMLYDGKTLPFPDNHFDCGIILTVLHHVEDPDALLKEIMRVCRSLVIIEDIYEGTFSKYLTWYLDTAANLWYSPCPHTNKDDKGWRNTFNNMQLKLDHADYRRVLGLVQQATYRVHK